MESRRDVVIGGQREKKEDQEKRYEKEGNSSGRKAEWAFMSLRHSEEKDGVGTREQR